MLYLLTFQLSQFFRQSFSLTILLLYYIYCLNEFAISKTRLPSRKSPIKTRQTSDLCVIREVARVKPETSPKGIVIRRNALLSRCCRCTCRRRSITYIYIFIYLYCVK